MDLKLLLWQQPPADFDNVRSKCYFLHSVELIKGLNGSLFNEHESTIYILDVCLFAVVQSLFLL